MIVTLVKQPAEVLIRSVEFGGITTIQSVIAVTVVARGLVVPAVSPLVVEQQDFAASLVLRLSGGDDGERYLVTARARSVEGEDVESELEIAVIDGAWVMPDGGAPLLSILEFVDRFGLEETVRMTDATGAGRIDRTYLVNALVDAQSLVEAHLATRYTLPLADPPPMVKLLVADLARARLYRDTPPEGVRDAARAAQRNLERIQSGVLAIPAAVAPAAATDNPVLVAPGSPAYPDRLDGYLDPFRRCG